MGLCQQEERAAGRPYPRTCPTCKLGPCSRKLTGSLLEDAAQDALRHPMTTPEDAEAMVALALEQAAAIAHAYVMRGIGNGDIRNANPANEMVSALRALRPDALAALARLREADRAEIERLTRELDAANDRANRARMKEEQRWAARVAELEADRVKIAETALRMAKAEAMNVPVFNPASSQGEINTAVMVLAKVEKAILAITPAAVIAQAEKD